MALKWTVPIHSGDARKAHQRFGRSPRTPAVPVLDASAYGTQAWLDARRGMIGASEMAAVLGLSPYASPFSLWWSKQEGWDHEQSMAMRIGHLLEPVIAALFAEARPDALICRANASLWRSPFVEWMGCTPDYLAVVANDEFGSHVEPVECKSDEGGQGWGKPGTDEVPEHHRIQALQQCEVLQAPRAHLVRMAGKRWTSYLVEFDLAAERDMLAWTRTGQSFVDSLAADIPPELDDHKATTAALRRLHAGPDDEGFALLPDLICDAYEAARSARDAARRECRLTDNLVRDFLGGYRYGRRESTGQPVVDRRVYKRRGYEVPASEVDALYPMSTRET